MSSIEVDIDRYLALVDDRERLEWLVQFLLYEDDGTKVRLDDRNSLSTGWHEDWRDAIDEAMEGGRER